MSLLYEQQLALALQTPVLPTQDYPCEFFPNVLLLMISNDPWEEQPYRREPNDTLNVKWINNLIEE